MPKTVQIRNIDDEVYQGLAKRAAEYGITVTDLLRREAGRLVAKPSMEDWLQRTRRRASPLAHHEVLDALDEIRGPWPDGGG